MAGKVKVKRYDIKVRKQLSLTVVEALTEATSFLFRALKRAAKRPYSKIVWEVDERAKASRVGFDAVGNYADPTFVPSRSIPYRTLKAKMRGIIRKFVSKAKTKAKK